MTITQGKNKKISADALDDEQFALNNEDEKDKDENKNVEEEEETTTTTTSKKKRKRNNKKNKILKDSINKSSSSQIKNDQNLIEKNNLNQEDIQDPPTKKKKKNNNNNNNDDKIIKNLVEDKDKSLLVASKIKIKQERKKLKAKEKRQKRKEAANETKQPLSNIAEESINEASSIGLQPTDLQLNYLKDRQKRALSDLSDLEFESFPLEKSWLLDVSDKPLRAHLSPWLKTGAVPGLLEALEETVDIPGAPAAIVVTSAALRAADLYRQLRSLVEKPEKSGQVTKLFAKHFKLKDHINHVKTTKISIAVGTPHRISTLLFKNNDSEDILSTSEIKQNSEDNILKLDRLKFIIFDLTWLDTKGFNLTELPDSLLKDSLWKSFLGFPLLIKRFQSGQTQLVLF